MPYYITKEIINKQISNIFVSAKAPYEVISKIENDLVNNTFNILNNSFEIEKIVSLKFATIDINDIVDLLFQVKDYKFYLTYIIQILLASKHYNEICVFFNRTFVNHIGNVSYVSKDLNYEFSERYFDRFIEAVKYCEIDNFKIIPFLFEIYKSEKGSLINKFLRPAKEFLKYFIANNEGTYLNYINTEENYVLGYKIYCEIFKDKGASKLVDNLVCENYFNKQDLFDLFIACGDVGINQLKEYIIKSSPEKQKIALNFYLTFGANVKKSLPELYEQVENQQIKSIIKAEIDLGKTVDFKSIKEFVEYATAHTHETVINQISTKYLTYLKNGEKANDFVITYLINVFKNITSPIIIKKYDFLLNFFSQTEIDKLGFNLLRELNGNINNENKWICAFVCAVCSDSVVSHVINLVPTCLGNVDVSTFVLGVVSHTGCASAINLIKQLYMESNNKQYYFSFLENLAEATGISALDFLDEMVPDYGLSEECTKTIMCNGETLQFEVLNTLNVKVKNVNSNNYVNLSTSSFDDAISARGLFNDLCFEIKQQILNFKNAFIAKRVWQPQVFANNILSNPLLKQIASSLVFGIYDKDNLIDILNFENIDRVDDKYRIALVHPCELNEDQLKQYYGKFEPFTQINQKVFVANNYDFSNNFSTVFNGVDVSDITFNNRLRTFDYKMSISNGVYYYKPIESANLLITVEIEKSNHKNHSIIGNIKFYTLSLLNYVNSKYVITDVNPEQIGSINARVYSNCLNEIFEACFK